MTTVTLESLRAERDALRAEVEAVNEKWLTAQEGWDASRAMLDRFGALLRAAQSLHRAWRRERDGGERLRTFVAALRDDGLDIDDPTTAPVWTGKIHDTDGRLVFDLATVGTPCLRCIEAIARRDGSQPQPRTCTWCGLPIDANAVTRTDAAGVAHAFHGSCCSAHAEWISGLARGTP